MARFGIAGVVATLGLGALAPPAQAYSRCDRACLEGFADRVTAAMAAHDPMRVPWASRAHYTENGQDIGIGDGLWGTASAVGRYRLTVADPEAGQIGLIASMFENGTPVLLALRLRIEDGTVSKAEAIVARNQPGSAFPNPG